VTEASTPAWVPIALSTPGNRSIQRVPVLLLLVEVHAYNAAMRHACPVPGLRTVEHWELMVIAAAGAAAAEAVGHPSRHRQAERSPSSGSCTAYKASPAGNATGSGLQAADATAVSRHY